MTRHEELRVALVALEQRVPDVHACVVSSRDGLPLAGTFGDGGHRVAAMAASVVGLAEEILADGAGATSTTTIRGSAGCLVVHPAGSGAVLAARTTAKPNVGLLQVELPATAAALLRSLEPC